MPEGARQRPLLRGIFAGLSRTLLVLSLGIAPVAATEVHTALKNGQFSRARALIEDGFDVDTRGPQGDTALHWVAFHGQTDLTRLLVRRGAKIDSTVRNGNTPLHLSAYAGQEQTLLLLLEAGANVNARNNDAITPLHWAARNGHLKILQLLLVRGADLNALDTRGRSALDYAASEEQGAAFEMLRDHSGTGLKAGTGLGRANAGPSIRASGSLSRQLDASSTLDPEAAAPLDKPRKLPGSTDRMGPSNGVRGPARTSPAPEPGTTANAGSAPDRSPVTVDGSQPMGRHSSEPSRDRPLAWLQLAAMRTESAARAAAGRIARKQKALLGDQTIAAHGGTLQNGEPIFRVRIGPLPDSQARRLCAQLKRNRQACFVTRATD